MGIAASRSSYWPSSDVGVGSSHQGRCIGGCEWRAGNHWSSQVLDQNKLDRIAPLGSAAQSIGVPSQPSDRSFLAVGGRGRLLPKKASACPGPGNRKKSWKYVSIPVCFDI